MALGYVAWIVNSMWSKTATSSPLSVDKHSFVEYFKSFPKGREVLALKVTAHNFMVTIWSFTNFKKQKRTFPPHHLLTMCAAIRASNLLEATSTPTLNWAKGGGGAVGLYIVLFSEIYPFEDCVPTILLPIF